MIKLKNMGRLLLIVMAIMVSCQKKNCNSEKITCYFDVELEQLSSVLSENQMNVYYEIWKSIFKEKNGLTTTDFNSHVIKTQVSSNNWSAGTSFQVDYIFRMGWLEIKCSDVFLVKMNSTYDAYMHLDIPRDEFFGIDEIRYNLSKGVHSEINTYQIDATLKYNNCDEVYNAVLINTSNENLLLSKVSYYVPGKLPKEDGQPYFLIRGSNCKRKEKCWSGYINLVTGEIEVNKEECVIIE